MKKAAIPKSVDSLSYPGPVVLAGCFQWKPEWRKQLPFVQSIFTPAPLAGELWLLRHTEGAAQQRATFDSLDVIFISEVLRDLSLLNPYNIMTAP